MKITMNSEIIIYKTEDGLTKIETRLEDDTVWLSQQQMAEQEYRRYQAKTLSVAEKDYLDGLKGIESGVGKRI
jgi:hypothetical protein